MIPAHRHPRQTPGLLRQGLRADDPGDVVAAVADIEADARGFGHLFTSFATAVTQALENSPASATTSSRTRVMAASSQILTQTPQ